MMRAERRLAIRVDSAVLEFIDSEDASLWEETLKGAKDPLTKACAAVGRIDLTGHEEFQWIGTGWLADRDVMVTNRHVALAFAERGSLEFRTSYLGAIGASIDFRRELNSDAARLFKDRCPDCYHHLGQSLAARGLHDKAVWCWRQALDLDDEYPRIDLRIAGALWRKGELQSARQH